MKVVDFKIIVKKVKNLPVRRKVLLPTRECLAFEHGPVVHADGTYQGWS